MPEKLEVIKNIEVKGVVLFKAGTIVDALKINNKFYKIFTRLGWFRISSEYFI